VIGRIDLLIYGLVPGI